MTVFTWLGYLRGAWSPLPAHTCLRGVVIFLVALAVAPAARGQTPELAPAQRQWLAAHKVIRVAPDPDLAPLDGFDAEGHQRGLSADYLKLIAKRLGVEFRVVRVPGRADALRALRDHRVDMLPAAFVVSGKDPGVLYTAAHLRLAAAIYARAGEPGFNNVDQLGGHSVGVVDASPWPELLGAQGGKVKLQKFPDLAAALGALRDKSVDAYVGDPFTAADAIARLKFAADIELSGQSGLEAPLAFAVRGDWPLLRDILDTALQGVSVDDEKNLRQRWLKNAATPAPDANAPALPPSHAAAIDAALQAVAKSHDLGADVRKQAETLLHEAQDDEAAADQIAAQWQALNQLAAGADAAAQKLEDALAVSDTSALLAWRAALPERASVEQLDALLARERDDLANARSAAAALQAEVDRQTLRPAQLRAELGAAQATPDQGGAVAPGAGSANVPMQAQSLRNQAAARLAASRIALLNLEGRSYEPRMRLLAAQLRDRQRVVNELAQHVAVLENLVLDRTGAAIAALQTRVAHERDQAVAQFRALNETATANLALVQKLAASAHDLGQLRTQSQDWQNWQRDTAQALKNTEERIRIGGVNEAVGLILLAEKSKLKPLPLLKRALANLQTELAQTRISLIDLREEQDTLGDLGAAVSQALSRLPEPAPERMNDLRTSLYRLLATRAEILPGLLLQQTRLAAADADAEQTLRDLVATTEKLGAMLDARLLWTPSQKPLDAAWFARLVTDAGTFFAPRRWSRVTANIANALGEAPLISSCALALLALLIAARWRAPLRLEHLAAPMRRIRSDRYALTSQALMWTVLAATPVPAALWLLGYLCRQVSAGNGNLTEEVGYAFNAIVPAAFALAFLRALCLENGLAQSHFRWPRPRREALRDATPWLALCVLPTQFVLSLLLLRGTASTIDTLGRLLLTAAALGVAVVTWRTFAPGRVWTIRGMVLTEPLRLRQIVRVVLCSGSVLMGVLVLRGYFVTVMTLSAHALESLGALLGLATVHGLSVRWLVLGERRLALKRMQLKQESDGEQRERGDGDPLPEPEPEEITLASVSVQTRRLLRALTIVAAISALLWIWSDVTPAVAMLDEIPVWKDQNVSLLGILEAAIVLTLTWVATRNLPGLLEIGLLRRFNVDAPTRYAVTSLTRYVIVFAGTIIGLSLLGLRWSNLQWLAAGFSVGLGFGMQEIFANFISGLMVLFERPFRVGDIITIGTIEGVVTRIRTRATTIVDWENKEILVPNKSFITDRLINWTLSDTITRISIKLGIAYRNDPRRAQQLLLEVAGAHPQVLADPPPSCWMTGFGDSAQNFELRASVAEIGQRASVSNDLQMRIAEVFRDNDIEIAYPQMDLWLRNPVQVQPPQPPAPTRA